MASPLKQPKQPALGQGLFNERSALVARLGGSFPVITAKNFFTLLPAVSDTFVESFCNKNPSFVKKAFMIEPKNSQLHERETFESLETLYNVVAKAYRDHLKAPVVQWVLVMNPDKAPTGDRNYYTKPDATQILYQSTQLASYPYNLRERPFREIPHDLLFTECATWWEFQKNDDPASAKDNYHKVIWNMCESLASDPRRFKIYGFTVENTTLRMWYHDHSGFLVSMPFDIFNEDRLVVRLLSALSQATPEEMGFDTSMRYDYGSSQTPTLVINVNDVEYKVVETLSDVRAVKNTVGSATRVWKVQNSDGNIYTIKDCWADKKRDEEWKHYKTIAALDMSEEERRHFIQLKSWHHTSRTTAGLRYGIDVDHKPRAPLEISNDEERGVTKYISLTVTEVPSRPLDRKTTLRRNDRLCFEGCGQIIYRAKTLDSFWTAWKGACTALHVLHRNDLAHRDISSGNVLFYEINNEIIGRICDFEFMKKVEYGKLGANANSARSWTYIFASHEVLIQKYLHSPLESKGSFDDLDPYSVPPDDPEASDEIEFIQNTIHDAESIFWVLLWGLTNAYPKNGCFICPDKDVTKRLIRTFASETNTAFKARHHWIMKGKTPWVHPSLTLPDAIGKHFCRLILASFQETEAIPPALVRSERGVNLCKTFATLVPLVQPSSTPITWHLPHCRHDQEECKLCENRNYACALKISFPQ